MENFVALCDAWNGGEKRFWVSEVIEADDGIGLIPLEGFSSFELAKGCARHRRKTNRVHTLVIDILRLYDRAGLVN